MNQNALVNALAVVLGLILLGAIFFFGAIGFAIFFVIVSIVVFIRLVMNGFRRPGVRIYVRQNVHGGQPHGAHTQNAHAAHKATAAKAKPAAGKKRADSEVTDVELH